MKQKKKHMKLITLCLPETWIQMLDEATDGGYAADRACAIRDGIRDYLKYHDLWRRVEVSPDLWIPF